MNDADHNEGFLKQLSFYITMAAAIVGAAFAVYGFLSGPVRAVEDRMLVVEQNYISKDDFRTLERKVDRLLIKQGIDPSSIK